jgi:CubicO group peptidase (beta-lactamase class C family)
MTLFLRAAQSRLSVVRSLSCLALAALLPVEPASAVGNADQTGRGAVAGTYRRGWQVSSAQAEGISAQALQTLKAHAKAEASTAIVVVRHGKLVDETWFDGEPRALEAMSATKSITGLALFLLLDQGLIPSLDTPLVYRNRLFGHKIRLRRLIS